MAFTPVQKLSITSGAAMVMLASGGVAAYLNTTQMVDAQNAAAHTNAIINTLDRVLQRTMVAENAARAFVATGDRAAVPTIDVALGDVEYALDSLRSSTEDHPLQRQHLDTLGPLVGTQFREIRQAVNLRQRSKQDSAAAALNAVPARRAVTARLLGEMRDEEVRVLGQRTRVMVASGRLSRYLIVGSTIFALVLALVALQPLRPAVGQRLTARLSRSLSPIGDDDLKD